MWGPLTLATFCVFMDMCFFTWSIAKDSLIVSHSVCPLEAMSLLVLSAFSLCVDHNLMCVCAVSSSLYSTVCLSVEFSSKNTGVDRHFLLQGIFQTQGSNLSLASPALADRFFTTVPPGKLNLTVASSKYRRRLVRVCSWSPFHYQSLLNVLHKSTVKQGRRQITESSVSGIKLKNFPYNLK